MLKKTRIEEKLAEFNVEGEVKEYHPGPVITTYEFYPNPGIKISQVADLSEDLSLALGAESVRIQRIPGKSSLGVEIPNDKREIIKLRDILASEAFIQSPSKLTFALGKTVHDEVAVTDLGIMPHLLIAGATGTGKSVCLNALIASILYKATPAEVKLILIDPKRLEFTLFEGIPHLLSPIINDPKKAGVVLMDAVRKMESRYKLLSEHKVRNIEQYNHADRPGPQGEEGQADRGGEAKTLRPLPYIVIIIDELAELDDGHAPRTSTTPSPGWPSWPGPSASTSSWPPSGPRSTSSPERSRTTSRAASPSASRPRSIRGSSWTRSGRRSSWAWATCSSCRPNYPRLTRLHCAYVSIPEIRRLVKFCKEQGAPEYDDRLVSVVKGTGPVDWGDDGEKDERYDRGRRAHPPHGTGLGLVSPAQAQARLRPSLAHHRPDGVGGPSRAVRRQQAARDPDRRQAVAGPTAAAEEEIGTGRLMPIFGSKRRAARKALANPNLQTALKRASAGHFTKFARTRSEVPWDEIKRRGPEDPRGVPAPPRPISSECSAPKRSRPGPASMPPRRADEALATIAGILKDRGAKLVAKSKSMVSEEIGLNAYLEERGFKVVETDLGEWIVQLAGERPSAHHRARASQDQGGGRGALLEAPRPARSGRHQGAGQDRPDGAAPRLPRGRRRNLRSEPGHRRIRDPRPRQQRGQRPPRHDPPARPHRPGHDREVRRDPRAGDDPPQGADHRVVRAEDDVLRLVHHRAEQDHGYRKRARHRRPRPGGAPHRHPRQRPARSLPRQGLGRDPLLPQVRRLHAPMPRLQGRGGTSLRRARLSGRHRRPDDRRHPVPRRREGPAGAVRGLQEMRGFLPRRDPRPGTSS